MLGFGRLAFKDFRAHRGKKRVCDKWARPMVLIAATTKLRASGDHDTYPRLLLIRLLPSGFIEWQQPGALRSRFLLAFFRVEGNRVMCQQCFFWLDRV